MMGLTQVIQPALEISAGAILGQVVPAKVFRMDPVTTSQARMSMVNIAVGLGLAMFGKAVLPRATAGNLGLGAMARGIVGFAQEFLPADLRGGVGGLGRNVTEADIDAEILAQLTAPGAAAAFGEDAGMAPQEDADLLI
jgi:hypothetical protein